MDEIVYFLKVDGIPGESTAAKHKNEISIETWSWGETQSAAVTGGGGGSGKVAMQPLHVSARTSVASPRLFLACASGQHIKEAVLTGVRNTKGKKVDFLIIKISDVLVSAYQIGGEQGDSLPLDTFDLDFSKVEIHFIPVKSDGSTGAPVKAGWDVKSNKGV